MPSPASPHHAVGELYLAHHSWIVQLLRRRLGNHQQAQDLAQDTFIRLMRQDVLPAFREPRAYLATVATRLCAEFFRRRALEQAYLESLALQPEQYAPSPEERELIMATLLQIDAMLRSLPAKVRAAFLMAQLDGLTYGQIAVKLGVSERMVKKYMAQAMLHCLLLAGD